MKINEISKVSRPGEYTAISGENTKKIADFIRKNCTQILKLYTENPRSFFFHGNDRAVGSAYVSKTISNRKPRDTHEKYHRMINSILRKAGFTALRNNSIFVSSDFLDASGYADTQNTFIIFPVDGFTFSYARDITDLTTSFHIGKFAMQSFKNVPERDIFINDMKKLTPKAFVEKYHFSNNFNLGWALNTAIEVLIHGTYVAVSYEYASVLRNLFQSYNPSNYHIDEYEEDEPEHEPEYYNNPEMPNWPIAVANKVKNENK